MGHSVQTLRLMMEKEEALELLFTEDSLPFLPVCMNGIPRIDFVASLRGDKSKGTILVKICIIIIIFKTTILLIYCYTSLSCGGLGKDWICSRIVWCYSLRPCMITYRSLYKVHLIALASVLPAPLYMKVINLCTYLFEQCNRVQWINLLLLYNMGYLISRYTTVQIISVFCSYDFISPICLLSCVLHCTQRSSLTSAVGKHDVKLCAPSLSRIRALLRRKMEGLVVCHR